MLLFQMYSFNKKSLQIDEFRLLQCLMASNLSKTKCIFMEPSHQIPKFLNFRDRKQARKYSFLKVPFEKTLVKNLKNKRSSTNGYGDSLRGFRIHVVADKKALILSEEVTLV